MMSHLTTLVARHWTRIVATVDRSGMIGGGDGISHEVIRAAYKSSAGNDHDKFVIRAILLAFGEFRAAKILAETCSFCDRMPFLDAKGEALERICESILTSEIETYVLIRSRNLAGLKKFGTATYDKFGSAMSGCKESVFRLRWYEEDNPALGRDNLWIVRPREDPKDTSGMMLPAFDLSDDIAIPLIRRYRVEE